MWDSFAYLGLGIALSCLIGVLARAARDSGLEEFTVFRFRFKGHEKPPKQLNK
jgi:hypothetical protein